MLKGATNRTNYDELFLCQLKSEATDYTDLIRENPCNPWQKVLLQFRTYRIRQFIINYI